MKDNITNLVYMKKLDTNKVKSKINLGNFKI